MPNQTLYDNFSQVRQYIDQEKPDLSSYVTKTELSNCGYLTSVPSEYITQQELSTNSYATTTYVSNNYLSLHGDRLMDGTLTLGNAVPAILGSERSWKIYEGGTGSNAYIALQANVDAKSFFIRDKYNNNIIQVYNSNAAGNYVKNYNLITYTCNIKPINSNSYSLGTSDSTWSYTYTKNLILNGTDINNTLSTINSTGKIHYGTAVHDRTSYTVTATVDDFETDSNGNPLVGTTICVKLTSITGTNPSTLYPIKFIVNGKELPRWYSNTAVTTNGRNWYRDMTDGIGRYWYWFWDGTYWVWQGMSEERDTTYSSMTDAEINAGTSTTGRLIKPVTLATYYTAKSCFNYDSSTGTLTITI